MADTTLQSLLQECCNHLDASALAYQGYLAGGKTFRYAQELKKYNGRIMAILEEASPMLPASLQPDAAAMLHHFRVWTSKWEELAAELNPGPDTVFVFANEVRFPRQSAMRIEEASRAMNGSGK